MNSRKSSTSTLDSEKTSPRLQHIKLKPIKCVDFEFMNFKKQQAPEVAPISDSDSSGSEHDVFDNDDILLQGIHFGDYDKLSPTD